MPRFTVNLYQSLKDEEDTWSKFHLSHTRSLPTKTSSVIQKSVSVPEAFPQGVEKDAQNDLPKNTTSLPTKDTKLRFRVHRVPKSTPKTVTEVKHKDPQEPTVDPKTSALLQSNDNKSSVLTNTLSPTKCGPKDPETAHESDPESDPEVVVRNIPGNIAKIYSQRVDDSLPSKSIKFPNRVKSIRRSNRSKAPFHAIRNPEKYIQLMTD